MAKVGRPGKGDRTPITVRVPTELLAEIEAEAARLGASSRAQYLADLVVTAMGRSDLALDLRQEVLPGTAA